MASIITDRIEYSLSSNNFIVNGKNLLEPDLPVDDLSSVDNNTTIAPNKLYRVDLSTANFTVNLPSGNDGDRIIFLHTIGLNTLNIIGGVGETIEQQSSSTLSGGQVLDLTFVAANNDWLRLNSSSEIGSLNSVYLSGNSTADTPAAYDDSMRIATTAFVQDNLGSYLPLVGGTLTGSLTVQGDLTVNGPNTELNSVTLIVEDKNVVLGSTTTPTDLTADGGGITLKGTTDKTFSWLDFTESWTSSENVDLALTKSYKINGVDVLTNNTVLGKSVPEGTIVGTTDSQTLTNKTLDAPVITGIGTAPTAAIDTSTTQLATTAFVQNQITAETGTSIQPYSAVLAGTTASFTIADESKLDGIEPLADVTDEANVLAALDGAVIATASITANDVILFQDISDFNNIKTASVQSIADLALLEHFKEETHILGINSTNPLNSFSAIGTQPDLDIVIKPKGNGAILVDIPDGAAAGGNLRGAYAIDLQLNRDSASQVSSGEYSSIVGGFGNTASGEASVALGKYASTKGRVATIALSSGKQAADGDSQNSRFIIRGVVNSATTISLTTNSNGINATSPFYVLDNYSVGGFTIRLTLIEKTTNNVADIEFKGTAVRDNGAATVQLLSGGTSSILVDNIGLTTLPVLGMNTTLGGPYIQVTGLSGRDLKAVATVEITENVYA